MSHTPTEKLPLCRLSGVFFCCLLDYSGRHATEIAGMQACEDGIPGASDQPHCEWCGSHTLQHHQGWDLQGERGILMCCNNICQTQCPWGSHFPLLRVPLSESWSLG